MRILHLLSCRGWSSDAYWAARACAELGRRGHAATLGCRAGTDWKVIDPARAEGVEEVERYVFASGLSPRADAADLRALGARFRHVDVVHVHRGKEHWLAAAAMRLSGVRRPLVRTRHIVQAVRAHAANRWLYRHATDLVVTVTAAIAGQYVAAGLVPPGRLLTLYGGVDTERFAPASGRERGLRGAGAGRELVLGMVGGLRHMKGHRVVLEALAALAAGGLALRLVIVGTGPEERALKAAVADGGLDGRVTFEGRVADVAGTLADFDAALYAPLESEGMSRVVFEYLAAGVPVVASRVGAVAELLTDGTDALLVPAGDAGALARAMARLESDPALRAALGARGREAAVVRFSGARLAASLESAYRALARV